MDFTYCLNNFIIPSKFTKKMSENLKPWILLEAIINNECLMCLV